MCQTALISNKIVRLGTRSYRQNIESMGNNYISLLNLSTLNNDLDNLYEIIYNQMSVLTQEDYKLFGDQLHQLIKTIKDLYNTCKKAPISLGIESEIKKLGMNYSALYELDKDLRNFILPTEKDPSLSDLLRKASKSLNKIAL